MYGLSVVTSNVEHSAAMQTNTNYTNQPPTQAVLARAMALVRRVHGKIAAAYSLNDPLGGVRESSRVVDRLLHDVVEQLVIVVSVKWWLWQQ